MQLLINVAHIILLYINFSICMVIMVMLHHVSMSLYKLPHAKSDKRAKKTTDINEVLKSFNFCTRMNAPKRNVHTFPISLIIFWSLNHFKFPLGMKIGQKSCSAPSEFVGEPAHEQ